MSDQNKKRNRHFNNPAQVHSIDENVSMEGIPTYRSNQSAGLSSFDSSDAEAFGEETVETGDERPLESRYELQAEIGSGGMGRVWKAVDRQLGRTVAIKRIQEDRAKSNRANRRFLNEARAVAQLNHPNTVQIFDFGRDAEGAYLVMEYIDGGDLLQLIREKGKLEIEEAVELISQVADALSQAHDSGTLHRDIKPANILLTEIGVPKLTDFGLAHVEVEEEETSLTKDGSTLGTPDYMAPEQFENAKSTDTTSDQWSLAATFYHMVTGQSPRGAINLKLLPKSIHDILQVALHSDPQHRYESVKAFKRKLSEALSFLHIEASRIQLCPSCHFENDSEHRFCVKCSTKLVIEDPCPKCKEPGDRGIDFCGQCGFNIEEYLENQEKKYTAARQQIRDLRGNYDFDSAIDRLREMVQEKHPRLEAHKKWAEEALPKYEKEQGLIAENVERLRKESVKAFEQHNYKAAARRLQRIPEPWRSEEDTTLLKQSLKLLNEIRELKQKIEKQVLGKYYTSELMRNLDRFLELSPEDLRAKKIREKLERKLHDNKSPQLASNRSGEHSKSAKYKQGKYFLNQYRIPLIAAGSLVGLLLLAIPFLWSNSNENNSTNTSLISNKPEKEYLPSFSDVDLTGNRSRGGGMFLKKWSGLRRRFLAQRRA